MIEKQKELREEKEASMREKQMDGFTNKEIYKQGDKHPQDVYKHRGSKPDIC